MVQIPFGLVDLRNLRITGLTAETALESVGITCNKNGVPFDPEKRNYLWN